MCFGCWCKFPTVLTAPCQSSSVGPVLCPSVFTVKLKAINMLLWNCHQNKYCTFKHTWQTQSLWCLHVSVAVGCLHFLQSLACTTVCQSGTATTTSCLRRHNMRDMFLMWFGRRGGHYATRPAVRWVPVCEDASQNANQTYSFVNH